MNRRYQALDHTADLALELWAPSLEGLFALGIEAMFLEMGVPTSVDETWRVVELESIGLDLEDLFVCVLSDALGTLELRSFLCKQATVVLNQRTDGEWTAKLELGGHTFDRTTERTLVEIKAVTYHGLFVEPADDGWHAQVTFDL